MGQHIILYNFSSNEHIDLGKQCGEQFQMPNEEIIKFLKRGIGDLFHLTTDSSFDRMSPEVDCWTNYIPKIENRDEF